MKIGFGCDHAAIDLKNELIEYMTEKGYECVDYGTGYDENGEIIKCDYPNKGREVGEAVVRKDVDEFFGAEFEGGRHQARVDMIHGIEADYSK